MSLYDDIGGSPAIDAALDRFYGKVLADPEVSPYFHGIDIPTLKARIGRFFSTALGGPDIYDGPGIRPTHGGVRSKGADDAVVDRFLGMFQATLEELGVPDPKVAEVMAVAESGRDDVLGR